MSRGYGYVQRFVLAELDERWAAGDEWFGARALAERLDGEPPTRRASRSVRRALRRLAADGLVEIGPPVATHDGAALRPIRGSTRDRMLVRIAPARADAADAAAERRARRARARDLRHTVSDIRRPFPINDQGAHIHVAPTLSTRTRA